MSDIVALVGVDYSVAFGSDTTVPDVVDDTNVPSSGVKKGNFYFKLRKMCLSEAKIKSLNYF